MNDHAASAANREEHALQTLLRAIASRDRRTMSRLLAESPTLARMALRVGASRDDERTYYLEEIAHYAYAGDTPCTLRLRRTSETSPRSLCPEARTSARETGVAPNPSTTRLMELQGRLRGTLTRNMPSWSS